MRTNIPWWIRIPFIFFVIIGLMEYFIDSGAMPAIIEYPITQFFLLMVLLILIAIELILQSVENVMFQSMSKEAQTRYLKSKSKGWEWKWGKKTYKKLLGSKPMEK